VPDVSGAAGAASSAAGSERVMLGAFLSPSAGGLQTGGVLDHAGRTRWSRRRLGRRDQSS
jgi:hypothetical protein